MRTSKYGDQVSFLDVMMTVAMLFMVMFTIAFFMMNKDTPENAKLDSKAELVIIIEWPEGTEADVDIWVRDPYNNILSYHNRDVGLMNLDRDDRGTYGDIVEGVVNQYNGEQVTIRGITPGEHIVGIHLFHPKDDPLPIEVKVKILKLNPRRSVPFDKTIKLTQHGQMITATRFTMNTDGSLSDFNDLQFDGFMRSARRLNPVHEPRGIPCWPTPMVYHWG
jgi:hypothetical protein